MNRSIDFRSDLYALGVTFYQMLTGPLPFTASYVKSASFSQSTSTLSRMKTASHLAVDVGGIFRVLEIVGVRKVPDHTDPGELSYQNPQI
jgi:serine/threonine protein kinase